MTSLYTLVTMAAIRYLSIVRYQRRWHSETQVTFWTSRYVQLIWVLALLMAAPPLLGIGNFVNDIGMIR